jgi:hypothetical protein
VTRGNDVSMTPAIKMSIAIAKSFAFMNALTFFLRTNPFDYWYNC